MLLFSRLCVWRRRCDGSAKQSAATLSGFLSTSHSHATLRELWLARWLIRQLIIRDLTVRYRHTWLGGLWAVLSPALTLGMYYTMFGLLVRMDTPDYQVPYVLVLLSGLVLWGLFQSVVNTTGDCLLSNLHLVKKIYFPRTVLTVACVGTSVVDFLVSLLLLVALCALYGQTPQLVRCPALILGALLTLLAARGMGCFLAVLRVRFKDIRHLTPLVMQALFYATPIVWSPGLLSPHGKMLMALNPLYGLCALFRYALLGGALPANPILIWTAASSLLLAAVGDRFFVHYEAQVIDRE